MKPARSPLRPLEIGLVSETFDTYPSPEGGPADAHVEYEPLATVELLEDAIGGLGHRSRRLGAPRDVLASSSAGSLAGVDVVWNIAEGYGSRNREAWAPALLEMAGIPCLGSDGLSLSLSLDKAWANRWAAAGGVSVAPQVVMASRREAEASPLPGPFPLFVKPCWEGTSQGIRRRSRVEDRRALAEEVARVVADYGQPALVERFLPGAEYTVTVVGHAPARALPVLQRALEAASGIGLHALEGVGNPQPEGGYGHRLPGDLDGELEARLQSLALKAFSLFGCLDFARVDFRLDETGAPIFLEINPLPTFAGDGSFGILAELEGRPVADLLADVLAEALERLGLAGRVGSSSGA